MRNLKLGLFSMLSAIFIFGITTAFDINVGPESYYGTLTLNRVNIMKSYGITGIVLDGTGYEISIASGATTGYGKISVYRICGQGGGNCKQVSQLSTTTPVMNSISDDGLVEKTNRVPNKVWKTDESGKPQWLDDDTGSISINAYTPTLSRGSTSTIIKINNSTASVKMPSNPHYTGSIVAAASNSGNNNSTSNTTNDRTYLNYVENSNVKASIQIKGSGSTTVSAKGGTITIYSTGGGGGDSLWTTSGNDIMPTTAGQNVAIGDNFKLAPHNTYQEIRYGPKIVFQPSCVGSTCAQKAAEFDENGHVGIGGNASNTYILYVGSETYIQGNVFKNNRVGIQKDYVNTSPNSEPLQISGGIQIGNTNSPQMNTNCNEYNVGAIEYHNGFFYGCVKKNNNDYKRGKIKVIFQEETLGGS